MAIDLAGVLSQMTGSGWGANGTPATITYSFLTSVPTYYNASEIEGFASFNVDQRLATYLAMSYWSRVANVEFVHLDEGGQISFGNRTNFENPDTWGVAYYPNTSGQKAGDIWIDGRFDSTSPHWQDGTIYGNANPTPGQIGFWVLLHEIGHALGLKHPSEGMFHSALNDGYGIYAQDINWRPDQPMLWDIAGIQALYGANMNANTGDTTYSFSDRPAYQAIWDAGGNDTISALNTTTKNWINLNPGEDSSIGTDDESHKTISLAYLYNGAGVIENAMGGGADDVITGNDEGNTLFGMGGADKLDGGKGDDILFGGDGADILAGGDGNDTLSDVDGVGGDVLDGGDGYDTYYVDDGDIIRDSDGQGAVYLNGKKLTLATRKKGETAYKDGANTYILAGGTLQINDPLTIEDFENGELGIYLDEEEDPDDPVKPPPYNPNKDWTVIVSSPLALDLNDNGVIDDIGLANSPIYFDLTDDGIAERTGWLAAEDGLLGMDFNGNGVIDQRSELFGNTAQYVNGFEKLSEVVDANQDGVVDAADPLFGALRVWRDTNQDGISQQGELQTLDELGITAIDSRATRIQEVTANGNNLVATAGFIRNGERKTIVDIEFAYDPALTNANPNRPLDLPPNLDSSVFQLPWLRGFGVVKSLPLAYQEDPSLQQAAAELMAQGWDGIFQNFERFMAKWTGLAAAHEARGVIRTSLTTEDKVWMLESLTGINVRKTAIEAADFGALTFPPRLGWDTNYIETQWQSFVQREAEAFAIQATSRDWLKGVYYSINRDCFIATDAARLQASLLERMNGNIDGIDAALAAQVLAKFRRDGVNLDIPALIDGLTNTPYKAVYQTALDSTAINGKVIIGNDSDNRLAGTSSSDILDGGKGDDVLDGGAGNDIYIFGNGYGHDSISDEDGQMRANVDTVRMAEGVGVGDVTVTRDYANLYLSLNGGLDRLTLQNWFLGDARKIEQVEFADGTVWDVIELGNHIVTSPATDGNDALFGTEANDAINGLIGDDQIAGFTGDDTLIGAEGNDSLYGGAGNDTLDGSAGNDQLDGDAGNDIYLFGNGYGRDSVSDYDWMAGNIDTIRMVEGVSPGNVTLTRDFRNLYISLNGGADRLALQNWYFGDAYKVERLEFSGGESWDSTELAHRVVVSPVTNGDDGLFGTDSADIISGLAGNDQIAGFSGNDTLDGGAGDDLLIGGIGDDTYVYNRGDGQDTISDYDGTSGNVDTLRFGEGVAASDITFAHSDKDLILVGTGASTDQVRIQNWGQSDSYRIERVTFADGTVWDSSYLQVQANNFGSLPVVGTNGNDNLFGGEGDNIFIDGIGDDYLAGGAGGDTYVFNRGGGQNTISDYDGIDTLRFGEGIVASDITFAHSGKDLIFGIGACADQVRIQDWGYGDIYRIERVEFADGLVWDNTYLLGQTSDFGSLPIVGTNGNDNLSGDGENNIFIDGAGNDYLAGSAGNDTYLFNRGGGQNTIAESDGGTDNVDAVRFGEGIVANDITFARSGRDLVLGISGSTDQVRIKDWEYGDSYRIERLEFADGTVWDSAYLCSVVAVAPIVGTISDDLLMGDTNANTFDGDFGNDFLVGGAGNDTYLFNRSGGQDTISDYEGIDTLRFGEGIATGDITLTRSGNDLILAITGTSDQVRVQNWGYRDNDRIERVEFADGMFWDTTQLQSKFEALTLAGTTNADYLLGNGGDNTFDGGAGNDVLQGGAGNDTYLFNLGSGQDTISEWNSASGNADTLRFGAGIAANDISLARSGNDLILSVNGTSDQVRIQGWGYGDSYRIERVEFADGAFWDSTQLRERVANLLDVPIVGSGGDDTLQGWQGGNSNLQGVSGNDTLIGNDGNDTLDGGTGNDLLQGGIGNDTYLFYRGGGQDTISEWDYTAGNVDTLRFGEGIASSDIILTRSANDLIFSIAGTSDQVRIADWWRFGNISLDRVEFADGTFWDAAQLLSQTDTLPIVGTTNADYLIGDAGDDFFDGGAGNDYLQGNAGNDIYLLNLGGGQDTIIEGSGNVDILRFGAGIAVSDIALTRRGYDLIIGITGTSDQVKIQNWGYGDYYRIERVEFADGTVWDSSYLQAQVATLPLLGTEYDDNLTGDSGNNTLAGGRGNDNLGGSSGNDTYLFNRGDGQDRIYDYDSSAGNVDILRFGEGIAPSDVVFSRNGNDIVLHLAGTDDQVTIWNWQYGDAYRIERVEFADGTSWDIDFLKARVDATPIVGSSADDDLYGNDGHNVLVGGTGNDRLVGNAGDDVYIFNQGDGKDTVIDSVFLTGKNQDTLRFGTGIAPDGITFSRVGSDLVLGYGSQGDEVRIQAWGFGEDNRVERVEFADGTVWDATEIQARVAPLVGQPIAGSSGDDALIGWADENAVLQGMGGNDTLSGNLGNDTLDGGLGNDLLQGDKGSDTYLFNLGDGQDTIGEWRESPDDLNTLRFGLGIGANDISISRVGADVILAINNTADQVTIAGWGNGSDYQIQRVEFANGAVWDASYLDTLVRSAPILGTTGSDYLSGDDGINVLDGLSGDDHLSGFAGDDVYVFGNGYGNDLVFDYDSTVGNIDTIRMAPGVNPQDVVVSRDWLNLYLDLNGGQDRLTVFDYYADGAYQVEQVTFADGTVWDAAGIDSHLVVASPTSGDDIICGSNAGETLSGLAGNDLLVGSGGNDILDGGPGNDDLVGDGGDDVYLFGVGDGRDTILGGDTNPSKHDVIQFKSGVAPTDVVVTRDYTHLILTLPGGDDRLQVTNYFADEGGSSPSRVEEIRFSDGTSWDVSTIRALLAPVATAGDDTLLGFDTDDVIDGLAGDDIINGFAGNDELRGGDGNDTLEGGSGDDLLVGGYGDDYLNGGAGHDTYLFNLGDGADSVWDVSGGGKGKAKGGGGSDSGAGNELRFGAGIRPDQIIATNRDGDLTLSIIGTSDRVLLAGWVNGGDRVDQVTFADGTIWNAATLESIMSFNTAPVVLQPLNQLNIAPNANFEFQIPDGVFQDPNPGDVLSYGATLENGGELPAWLSFDVNTRTLSGAPSGSEIGTWRIAVIATDPFGEMVSDIMTLEVANPNNAPTVAIPIENTATDQGADFVYALPPNTFIDSDNGDSLTLTADLVGGEPLPGWLRFDAVRGEFSGTPGNNDVGSLAIRVTATDTSGASVASNFSMSVTNVNDAPTLAVPLANQAGNEDAAITFSVPANAFADIDAGDYLALTASLGDGSALPNWLTFDGATRTFSGIPTNADVGNLALKVVATDLAGASASSSFSVTIANVNDAPLVKAVAVELAEDQLLTLAPAALLGLAHAQDIDPTGDVLAISAVGNAQHGVVAQAESGQITFAPEANFNGTASFDFTVSDGNGGLTTQTATIVVTPVNDAPVVATPIAEQSTAQGAAFRFAVPPGTFVDIDSGDQLSYTATLANGEALPSWLTFDAATQALVGTTSNADVGNLQIKLTATDLAGASAMGTFGITVANVNDAPITSVPLADQVATEDQVFHYVVPVGTFTDPDTRWGDVLSYTATLGNGNPLPSWLSFDAATATFSGTPLNADVGTVSVKVIATDLAGSSTFSTFGISVANVNDAPVLAQTLANQAATEGIAFAVALPAGAFQDIDAGDTLSYSAKLVDGSTLPSWLSFNAATRTFSGTAGQYDIGSLQIIVTASDTVGLTASGTFQLGIAAHGVVSLVGTTGADTLIGFSGADTLDGAAGADQLIGRGGNDTYIVDNVGDVVVENANEGIDTVQASVTYTLSANIENLTLTGTAAINGTGNALANTLTGNNGNNVLDGGAGADALVGGAGNDTYVVDNAGDVVSEAASAGTDLVQASVTYTLATNLENLTLTGSGAINGTGNTLNNVLTGNTADNVLDGGTGADTMMGGAGNDTYVVDNATDIVTENANEGTDLVQSSVTYSLAANVENLTLTGTTAINGTGNALDNVLQGNSAANTLTGGAGNDTYFVSTGDTVTEAASAGTDTVIADITWALGANLENLTLTGAGAINATGNTLNNILTGNSAANTLSGGTGADTMIGGAGDDTYVVDNTADVISENAGEGTDLVQSSVTYTLAANVEKLTLTGTTAINGTGNALDNVLTGNTAANTLTGGAGNDTLNGGTGADTMVGGTGNDTYVVDNTADVVTEAINEGTDLIQSSVTYTLAANVENLTLTGTMAINGTGNALDNILIGNSANNTLTGGDGNDTIDGGVGNDTMVGGLGDDVYVVNVSTDVVTEAASAGNDTIQSAVTLTLTTNVENLVLTGTTAINGTGNTLNNLVRGNTAINTLNGGTGNDILEGGDGNDILTDTSGTALFNGGAGADTITGSAGAEIFLGGLGNDTYTTAGGNDIILFNRGDGQDTFATGGTGSDVISLGGGITYADLVFTKSTNDLVLKIGATDQITFKDWYAATPSKPVTKLQVMAEAMAGFVQGGGNALLDQKVENFNFAGLAGAFDTARAANSGLTSWALTNALTSFQLAGSDTAALGGDLAYQYGKNGTLAGIGVTPALATLSDANLGTNAQTLTPLSGLQTGSVRLS